MKCHSLLPGWWCYLLRGFWIHAESLFSSFSPAARRLNRRRHLSPTTLSNMPVKYHSSAQHFQTLWNITAASLSLQLQLPQTGRQSAVSVCVWASSSAAAQTDGSDCRVEVSFRLLIKLIALQIQSHLRHLLYSNKLVFQTNSNTCVCSSFTVKTLQWCLFASFALCLSYLQFITSWKVFFYSEAAAETKINMFITSPQCFLSGWSKLLCLQA